MVERVTRSPTGRGDRADAPSDTECYVVFEQQFAPRIAAAPH